MKSFIILSIFFTCSVVVGGFSNPLNKQNCRLYKELQTERQTRIYEKEIISLIEQFRDTLKNEGLPEFGIDSLDPLNLEKKRLHADIEDFINFDLNTTLYSEGLLGFEIEKLKIGLIGLKFDFIINWPVLIANGTYGLDAKTPLAPLKLFGNGDVDIKATNLKIVGKGNLKSTTVDGKLKILIGKAEVDIQLEKFDFKITGVLDSDSVSKLVSDGLSIALPTILQELHGDLNGALAGLIEKLNDLIISQKMFETKEPTNVFDYVCENLD